MQINNHEALLDTVLHLWKPATIWHLTFQLMEPPNSIIELLEV